MKSLITSYKQSFTEMVSNELILLFDYKVFDKMFHIELVRDGFTLCVSKENIRDYGNYLKGSYLSTVYWLNSEFQEKFGATTNSLD